MHWLRRLWSGRRLDADLDAELRFHVDEETDRLVAEGLARPEARRRALAAFGGLAPMREHTLDARGTRWVHDVLRDVRYAFRMMRRTPVFTAAVAGSIAIGVGAMCVRNRTLPARLNSGTPAPDLNAGPADVRDAPSNHMLICTNAQGGQNGAVG